MHADKGDVYLDCLFEVIKKAMSGTSEVAGVGKARCIWESLDNRERTAAGIDCCSLASIVTWSVCGTNM